MKRSLVALTLLPILAPLAACSESPSSPEAISLEDAIREPHLDSGGAPPARTGEVARWGEVIEHALEAIPDPFVSTRHAAMAYLAVSDSLNAIQSRYQPYALKTYAPGASPEVAIATAAHDTLSEALKEYALLGPLVPSAAIQAAYDEAYAAALAKAPEGAAKEAGIALGRKAASAVLQTRKNDNVLAAFLEPYTPGTGPGRYQLLPLPPGVPFTVLLPGYDSSIQPFVIKSASQFRPAPPFAVDSAGYLADFNEIKALGRADSTTRTAEQTEIGRFWYENSTTSWSRIARHLAEERNLDDWQEARALALVTLSIADGVLAQFDAKYTYDFWRPVSALRAEDTGNPAALPDPTWAPLCATPPTPEYPSGHSLSGGAAAAVLTEIFGHHVAFGATSLTLPDVTREFASFDQAAEENAASRVYCGIHFRNSTIVGLRMGRKIASYVTAKALRPNPVH
jgi:PAP2 superfamily protein